MRIAISGASGNISIGLLRRLEVEGNHDIVELSRRPPRSDEAPNSVAHWYQVDLADRAAVTLLTDRASTRRRCGRAPGLGGSTQPGSREAPRTNQDGTRSVVEAIVAARVPRS